MCWRMQSYLTEWRWRISTEAWKTTAKRSQSNASTTRGKGTIHMKENGGRIHIHRNNIDICMYINMNTWPCQSDIAYPLRAPEIGKLRTQVWPWCVLCHKHRKSKTLCCHWWLDLTHAVRHGTHTRKPNCYTSFLLKSLSKQNLNKPHMIPIWYPNSL